jgi:hypothetical protein
MPVPIYTMHAISNIICLDLHVCTLPEDEEGWDEEDEEGWGEEEWGEEEWDEEEVVPL